MQLTTTSPEQAYASSRLARWPLNTPLNRGKRLNFSLGVSNFRHVWVSSALHTRKASSTVIPLCMRKLNQNPPTRLYILDGIPTEHSFFKTGGQSAMRVPT